MCVFVYVAKRLQQNYRGKRVKMLNESQKTNAQIRQRKKCTQTHFFCAFVQNLQWEDMQYAKNIRDSKICAKNGMEIAAHKTYLVYAAFWCSENCAAKCWKQKWHKSGAARLGSGFCAIYVVIYLRQYRIILSADTASEVPQPPERCLSRQAGIVRCCLKVTQVFMRAIRRCSAQDT